MEFINITDENKLNIYINKEDNTSTLFTICEEHLIKGIAALFDKGVFHHEERVACGFPPSPDIGYFQLADRYWRASLCIYFSGATGCFREKGGGYPEPWLFNARHSIELYLKGFLMYASWFKELQHDFVSSTGARTYFNYLMKYLKPPHKLYDLYGKYREGLNDVNDKWDKLELSEHPQLERMLLRSEGEDLLKEIDEADDNGFRFRYPTIADYLQKQSWVDDISQLLPRTGLPKKAGFLFDHVKVINSLHKLIEEINSIESYLNSCWDYIGEYQDIAIELMEVYSE